MYIDMLASNSISGITPTATPAPCVDFYEPTKKYQGFGAEELPRTFNLDDCFRECSAVSQVLCSIIFSSAEMLSVSQRLCITQLLCRPSASSSSVSS